METKTLNQRMFDIEGEIAAIPKDAKNPFFNSKYFTIDTVLESVKPIAHKHGVRINQPLKGTGILTRFTDMATGEKEEEYTECPQNPDPQKQGAIYTYWRRYALVAYLGLEGEQDTDANDTASNPVQANLVRNTSDPVAAVTSHIQKAPLPEFFENQEPTTCTVCGAVATYKSGTSKAGKPYKGYFCTTDKTHAPQWVK